MHFRTSTGYFTAKPIECDQFAHSDAPLTHPNQLYPSGKPLQVPTHTINGLPVQIFGPEGQIPTWEGHTGWQSRTVAQKQSRRWVSSGVHWHAHSKRWQVRIAVNTLSVCGGYYATLIEAENMANMLRPAHGLRMLLKPKGDEVPVVGSPQWCQENFILDEHGTLYRIRINGTLLRTRLTSRTPNVREIDALLHAAEIRAVLQGTLDKARVYGSVDAYGVRLGARLSDMGLDCGDEAATFGTLPVGVAIGKVEVCHA